MIDSVGSALIAIQSYLFTQGGRSIIVCYDHSIRSTLISMRS